MKGKSKSSTRKLGLATALLLCSLSFLAGLFASTFFSQDVPIIKPGLRRLEVVHAESEAYRDPMPNGETGESSIESIPFQVLSWKPRAYYFPNFATIEQCERVIEMAKFNLKPSSLALRKGETVESTKGTRTSSGTFISASKDQTGTLDCIEKKIAKVTSIPQSHGEAFNILRYEIGQKYDSHYDAFNPSEYGPQSSQRVASFLLYLSDVEEGGETMFPFEISLHGSCPVIKGEKWVATKWIRDQEQDD